MSGRRKPSAKQRGKVGQAPLAREQFPELNATLYATDPAAYLRFRLHTLLTMYNQASDGSSESHPWEYGIIGSSNEFTFSDEERQQAIALESTMLVHHAGESLLRLYIAHSEGSDCPWMGVAKLRFPDVKKKSAEYAQPGWEWPNGQIEEVFLGGADRDISGTDMSQEEWDETCLALRELLRRTAERVLDQAHLYNAAKHGLVGVPGEVAEWSHVAGGQNVAIARGRGITYLSQEGAGRQWAAATDIVDIESDFLIVQQIALAVHNLWATARRRYLALEGVLYSTTIRRVNEAFLIGVAGKRNIVRGMRVMLHEKVDVAAPWGSGIGPAKYSLSAVKIPEDVVRQLASKEEGSSIVAHTLPIRGNDSSPFTGGNRYLFSFTPKWASTV